MKNSVKKTALRAIACAAAAMLALTGCAGGTDGSSTGSTSAVQGSSAAQSADGKVQISLWHSMSGANQEVLDGIVADYWTQLKQHTNPLSKLTKEGKLDESQIMDLSELVLGTKKLRTSDDQFVAAASMGLGALDIMIAYQLYLNATEMGIGTKVNLWDKPLWE